MVALIGNLTEHGNPWVETPDSGIPSRRPVTIPTLLGSMIRQEVTLKFQSFKYQIDLVIDTPET